MHVKACTFGLMKTWFRDPIFWLMASCMVLIAIVGTLWSVKSYEDERDQLEKELNILFATTVRSLEDSLIQSVILTIADSTDDTFAVYSFLGERRDSIMRGRHIRFRDQRIRHEPGDSLKVQLHRKIKEDHWRSIPGSVIMHWQVTNGNLYTDPAMEDSIK